MQKITPFLWFDKNAEEAAKFYTTIFKDSKILGKTLYATDIAGMKKGAVMTVEFQLGDQKFVALNGGPVFKFSEAVSFVVNCRTQEEIDHYWENLSRGGDETAQRCGWLKDKYGVSWQIIPSILPELLQGKDGEKTERVMKAMLQMKKIDIDSLMQA